MGVGFDSENLTNAVTLTLAIGTQNVLEGQAVAVSALNAGRGAYFDAGLVGVRAGLIEFPMTPLGAWAVRVARPIRPYAMGFAAGAMLYVIGEENIPETHRSGHEYLATLGTPFAVIRLLFMDLLLG